MPPSSADQLMTALAKIGLALRHEAWQSAHPRGLTPTQAQALATLSRGHAPRLAELARELGVSAPTASEALSSLVEKGLVEKTRADGDGRALVLVLTASGKREAARAREWPEAFLDAASTLAPEEQGVLLRTLTKLIRRLQVEGRIPLARMCASCRYFRPHAHASATRPHHCDFVDAAFGERELRLECAEHAVAEPAAAEAAWRRFASGGKSS